MTATLSRGTDLTVKEFRLYQLQALPILTDIKANTILGTCPRLVQDVEELLAAPFSSTEEAAKFWKKLLGIKLMLMGHIERANRLSPTDLNDRAKCKPLHDTARHARPFEARLAVLERALAEIKTK